VVRNKLSHQQPTKYQLTSVHEPNEAMTGDWADISLKPFRILSGDMTCHAEDPCEASGVKLDAEDIAPQRRSWTVML